MHIATLILVSSFIFSGLIVGMGAIAGTAVGLISGMHNYSIQTERIRPLAGHFADVNVNDSIAIGSVEMMNDTPYDASIVRRAGETLKHIRKNKRKAKFATVTNGVGNVLNNFLSLHSKNKGSEASKGSEARKSCFSVFE